MTTTYDDWYNQYHVPASDLTAKLDTVISLLQQLVDRKLPRLSDGPSVDPIVVSYPTVGTEPPYQVGYETTIGSTDGPSDNLGNFRSTSCCNNEITVSSLAVKSDAGT